MEADEFGTQLFETVVAYARGRGYELGEGANGAIRYAASQAPQRFAARGLALDENAMNEARLAFVRLIEEMIVEANSIPGYAATHPGIIGEQTFGSAWARLCPLFPLC